MSNHFFLECLICIEVDRERGTMGCKLKEVKDADSKLIGSRRSIDVCFQEAVGRAPVAPRMYAT